MQTITARDYLRVLEPFARAAQAALYRDPISGLRCYGTGGSDHWSVQTNLKACAALAVLATDPDYEAARAGVSRDDLADQALDCLRFALETHHSGTARCSDGKAWGHSWISALGLERCFHGLEALAPRLNADDHAGIARVVSSEADWLLTSYDVKAGPVENNKPESNLWNGILLHRAAILAPNHEHAAAWQEEGTRFLVNGISHPGDARSDALIAGKPLREWHVGANFLPTWGLNHHHYLNVGYMVICLSQVAMMHFWCKARGIAAPEALEHHAADLWEVVRHLTMPDGRLARIGGDTRVRYNYCQDYAIPTWLWALDRHADQDVPAWERGWLAQVRRESAANPDGSFCGERLAALAGSSAVYWLRLESDRASTLSMGLWWRRQHDLAGSGPDIGARPQAWSCDYHGAALVRGTQRFASWCWRSAEAPTGLCVGLDGSDLMEWRENLGVRVRGVGRHHRSTLLRHTVSNFNQGFTTCGRLAFASEGQVAEGFHGAVPIGTLDLAAVALPDDASMVVLQRYRSPPERTWLTCFQAVNALLPNDLWNGNRRSYVWEDGSKDCSGGAANDEEYIQTKSPWICCDNRIGFALIGDGLTFSLYHPGRRQIGLTKHDAWEDGPGYLACDELGVGRRAGLHEVPRDCNLADLAFVVVANGRPKPLQRVVQTARRLVSEGDLRMVEVPGQDGRNYLIAANFGDATLAVPIPQGATTLSLPAAADGQPVMLGAGQVGCWSLG